MVLNNNVNSFCCGGLMLIDAKVSADASTHVVGALVLLKKGDKATIGVKHWSGSVVVHDWSVFSAVKVGGPTTVGFASRLDDSLTITHGIQSSDVGWSRIEDFVTKPISSTDYHTQFDNTDGGFSNGLFTAPVKGVYAVEAAARFDGADGHYFRLVIAKNGDMDALGDGDMGDTVNGYLRSGLAAIRADGPSNYYSLAVSGFILMEKDDTVGVYTYGTHTFTVHADSGFSAALIHEL